MRFEAAILVSDPLSRDLSLELRERQQHVQGEAPHGSRRVELLRHRHERHALGVEDRDDLGEVHQGPCQTVHLVDDDRVDLARLDVRKQPLEAWPLKGSAGVASVVVARADRLPALPGLASNVGLASLALGVERVEALLEALLGGLPRVGRTAAQLALSAAHEPSP